MQTKFRDEFIETYQASIRFLYIKVSDTIAIREQAASQFITNLYHYGIKFSNTDNNCLVLQ